VEEYVQDLDDAEVLLDMISTAESFENPTAKRTEQLFAEVPHRAFCTDNAVLLERPNPSRSPVRHTSFWNNHHLPVQLSRSNRLQPHRRKTLPPHRKGKHQSCRPRRYRCHRDPPRDRMAGLHRNYRRSRRRDDNEAGEEQVGDVVEAREKRILAETSRTEKEVTAKVVGVVKRNWRTYVGHIDPSSIPPGPASSRTPTNVFLLPLQRQIPKIRIRTRRPQALLNQRVLAVIDGWPATSRYPEGHFVRALGQIESREAETEALLVEWDVIYRGFSEGVLKCLPEEGHGWKVPEVLPDGRRDFRDRLVCSIDPVGIAPSVPAGLI
jgi:hypothetical protein